MTRNRPLPNTPPLGSVHIDEIMPAREFCRRMGLGRKAWSALLHRQFPIVRCGKQIFVIGESALSYFHKLAAADQAPHDADQHGPGAAALGIPSHGTTGVAGKRSSVDGDALTTADRFDSDPSHSGLERGNCQ